MCVFFNDRYNCFTIFQNFELILLHHLEYAQIIFVGAVVTPLAKQSKGLDIEAVGTINGTNVYDFDIESLQAEEKPWKKPGEIQISKFAVKFARYIS